MWMPRSSRVAVASALAVTCLAAAIFAPAAAATFPGRNGLIAFEDDPECEDQLQIMRPDGTGRRSLGPSSCDVDRDLPFLLEWMPNGRHLLLGMPGSGRNVLLEPRPGARPERLPGRLPPRDWGEDTSVSPGGTRIAYVRWKNLREGVIWTAKLDGTDRRELGPGSFPLWSPRGRTLAYLERFADDAHPDGGGHLSLMDARTGKHIRRLAEAVVPDYQVPLDIDWAPDGAELVLGCPGDASLCTVRARDGRMRRLEIPGAVESNAVFSPDGRYLLFAQQTRFEHDSEFGWTYRDSIRRIGRSGGRSKRIWRGPRPDDPEVDAEEGGNSPPTLSWQPLP